MLPPVHKILFLLFAVVTGLFGLWGFYRLYLRVRRGHPERERRTNNWPARLGYALRTTLLQERTFRKRRALSVFHAFIFYGFVFYLLVNVVDGLEGYAEFNISSASFPGALYNLLADVLSFLVLLGVVAFVVRRYLLPSRRDFRFNEKTLLRPEVRRGFINRDSAIVSAFILFHVGSRALGQGAKLALNGRDPFQPFASSLSSLFTPENAEGWRVFGYWGALGSVLLFLAYFPYSKHLHIFTAPLNYFLKRDVGSGVLPPMKLDLEAESPQLGAETLTDLTWPRLLDAYACIQCNRCQDVCPASATGKALSPAALEINKRLELNALATHASPFTLKPAPFEVGTETSRPLLEFAISPEAVWACTTCGACMQVCPTQDEQMLDIVDIRRQQVMVAGEFPPQLQSAFRGMERAKNPWGIALEKRMEWAEGLKVPTIEENPEPDVLYWVGCAAAYDPGAQKTARAFVQLLDHAGVNYAVLGKRESCTGDSARRAGNEYLYQQLAEENIATLNQVRPRLIVATCPHCMNIIGGEYPQLGGHYQVIHHTQYLETLVAGGSFEAAPPPGEITYHDPCYLGRHNGVYAAPREVIRSMGAEVLELERSRENSFCCGAGGAQFWKEEEAGSGRISDNRVAEIQKRLDAAKEGKTVAVGCPFCKSMLNSTPAKEEGLQVKDVAELLLEGVSRAGGATFAPEIAPTPPAPEAQTPPLIAGTPSANLEPQPASDPPPILHAAYDEPGTTSAEVQAAEIAGEPLAERKKWRPKGETKAQESGAERKKWQPKTAAPTANPPEPDLSPEARREIALTPDPDTSPVPERKKWTPKSAAQPQEQPAEPAPAQGERPKWTPKAKATPAASEPVDPEPTEDAPARKKWTPKNKS